MAEKHPGEGIVQGPPSQGTDPEKAASGEGEQSKLQEARLNEGSNILGSASDVKKYGYVDRG